jgi:hypothetical protein
MARITGINNSRCLTCIGRDADGCSIHTPVACDAMKRIQSMQNLTVTRAEFSVVDSTARILPHYGMTNGQVKFHLGLVVPGHASGEHCVFLAVDGAVRGWSEGGVLIFDDSFQHEVWNDCVSERVVFQLVVTHPLLLLSQSDSLARARPNAASGAEPRLQIL